MNKAKGLIALGVIVVVTAVACALLLLNENGRIGTPQAEETTTVQTTTEVQTTEVQTTEKEEESTLFSDDEIENFLSVFANYYFAEQSGSFNSKDYDPYDLILFAYTYTKHTDKLSIKAKNEDDNIDIYMGIPIEKVNEVLDEYFGLVVDAESAYTENDYAFFRYEDGYFWTPAADGVGYTNYILADSVVYDNEDILVQFTIFNSTIIYAVGEARIKATDDGMKLDLYNVRF